MKKWTAFLLVLTLVLGVMAPALAEDPTSLTVWHNHTWYPNGQV